MFIVFFSADLVTEAQRVKNGLNFVTLSISENSIRHYLNAENIKLLDQDHEPLPKESVLRTYTDTVSAIRYTDTRHIYVT